MENERGVDRRRRRRQVSSALYQKGRGFPWGERGSDAAKFEWLVSRRDPHP